MYILSVVRFSEIAEHPNQGSLSPGLSDRRFDTGALLMTEGVHRLVEQGLLSPSVYLDRHCSCDWGDLCEEDVETNQQALLDGERLFSAYQTEHGDDKRLWIITEADRSSTTLLLPSEY